MEISHGSVVAHLRCGGIFNNDCIANLVVSPIVKEFENRVNILRSFSRKSDVLVFITHSVHTESVMCE